MGDSSHTNDGLSAGVNGPLAIDPGESPASDGEGVRTNPGLVNSAVRAIGDGHHPGDRILALLALPGDTGTLAPSLLPRDRVRLAGGERSSAHEDGEGLAPRLSARTASWSMRRWRSRSPRWYRSTAALHLACSSRAYSGEAPRWLATGGRPALVKGEGVSSAGNLRGASAASGVGGTAAAAFCASEGVMGTGLSSASESMLQSSADRRPSPSSSLLSGAAAAMAAANGGNGSRPLVPGENGCRCISGDER